MWIGKTNGSEPLKTRRDEPIDVETEVDIGLAISLEETYVSGPNLARHVPPIIGRRLGNRI